MVNMIKSRELRLQSKANLKSSLTIFQGIVTLFQNLFQLDDIKSDPSLVPAFVEELCRYHTASAMATRRVAKVDIILGDTVRLYQFHLKPQFTNNL